MGGHGLQLVRRRYLVVTILLAPILIFALLQDWSVIGNASPGGATGTERARPGDCTSQPAAGPTADVRTSAQPVRSTSTTLSGRVEGVPGDLAGLAVVSVEGSPEFRAGCDQYGHFQLDAAIGTGRHRLLLAGERLAASPCPFEVHEIGQLIAGIRIQARLAIPLPVSLHIDEELQSLFGNESQWHFFALVRDPSDAADATLGTYPISLPTRSSDGSASITVDRLEPLQVTLLADPRRSGTLRLGRRDTVYDVASRSFSSVEFRVASTDLASGVVLGDGEEPLSGAEVLTDTSTDGFVTGVDGFFVVPAAGVRSIFARFGKSLRSATTPVIAGQQHSMRLRVDTHECVKVRVLGPDRMPRERVIVSYGNNPRRPVEHEQQFLHLPGGVAVLKPTSLPPGTRLYFRDPEFGEWRQEFTGGLQGGMTIEVLASPTITASVQLIIEGNAPPHSTISLTEVESTARARFRQSWSYLAGIEDLLSNAGRVDDIAPGDYLVELKAEAGKCLASAMLRAMPGNNTLRLGIAR